MKKILHITNWYPNPWHSVEGIFVRDQFEIFSRVTDAKLINVQVRSSEKWFELKRIAYSDLEIGYYLLTKIKRAKIVELLSTLLLLWVLRKEKANAYDLVHIHIAYPLLVHYHWWKNWVKCKLLVSEHWSAYHFNFYLPKDSPKLTGIRNIFKQDLPIITVSEALLKDIRNFAGTSDFKGFVLPNVIDLETYSYIDNQRSSEVPVFFMVNVWREIKNPFPLLETFSRLANSGFKFKLCLGGFGPILEKMQDFVKEKEMSEQVAFLGKMDKQAIAKQLHESDAYLFSSEYETFSVSCAQALSCGVPLVGPAIPAIQEYAGSDDMVIVDSNDVSGWEKAIKQYLEIKTGFNRKAIASRCHQRFSVKNTLNKYKSILDACEQEDIGNA